MIDEDNFGKIYEIRKKLKDYTNLYNKNEQAVSDHIIKPILRILGWDPEDPSQVRPVEKVGEVFPDYTLVKDGKVMLFIEAKNGEKDVTDKKWLTQLVKYSIEKGIKFGSVLIYTA